MTKRNINRRSVLKGTAAAAGVAAGSGALSGFPMVWANKLKDITLRSIGSAVTHQPPWAEQAMADLGFKVDITALDFDTITNRINTQPGSFDIAEPAFNYFRRLSAVGNIQPIDTKRLTNWDEFNDLYRTGKLTASSPFGQGQNPTTVMYTKDGKSFVKPGQSDMIFGLPSVHNADTLGYRPDLTGRKLESWSELISDEWRGKVALQGFPDIAMMDVALAIEGAGIMKYGNKGNMTKEEIDKTFVILNDLKKKGHIRAFWTGFMESVNMMVSGETVIQSMWSPAVTVTKAMGVPCVYGELKEGYRGWTIGYVMPKGLKGLKRDAAYEFFNWLSSGWSGAYFSRQGYYMPTLAATKKFMTSDEWGFWYDGKPAAGVIPGPDGKPLEQPGTVRDGGSYQKRMGNIAVWNSEYDEFGYLLDKWNKFQSG
jgi:putative spermidine/putrescine transport system substrate-binding protein